MPRISVLIPTWNRERYLGRAIESVLEQSYRDFEIVVADDGSEDATAELVRRYAGVRYVYQPHRGIPAARNLALEAANGELIAWLDSDDLYAPAKLEKQAAYLDAHPECGIVFCLARCIPDTADLTDRQRRMAEVVGGRMRTCLPTACIRRDLFERYGRFDEKYAFGEDTEWVARISAAGADTRVCLEERLYVCRIHDGQGSYAHGPVGRRENYAICADAIRRARKMEKDLC